MDAYITREDSSTTEDFPCPVRVIDRRTGAWSRCAQPLELSVTLDEDGRGPASIILGCDYGHMIATGTTEAEADAATLGESAADVTYTPAEQDDDMAEYARTVAIESGTEDGAL